MILSIEMSIFSIIRIIIKAINDAIITRNDITYKYQLNLSGITDTDTTQ